MYHFETKTEPRKPEKNKIRKKMSKAEMQLAITKKRQCDVKALAIVEQLLESNVNAEWLLQNLKYINKHHLEDVIEERAIIKLCGYVLCNKSLTVMIKQQYRISTRQNKVYDVSRRKNYCSSQCYGASNHLLQQLLTSPLWLREKEEIPLFRLFPLPHELSHCTFGDEVDMGTPNAATAAENNPLCSEFEQTQECNENTKQVNGIVNPTMEKNDELSKSILDPCASNVCNLRDTNIMSGLKKLNNSCYENISDIVHGKCTMNEDVVEIVDKYNDNVNKQCKLAGSIFHKVKSLEQGVILFESDISKKSNHSNSQYSVLQENESNIKHAIQMGNNIDENLLVCNMGTRSSKKNKLVKPVELNSNKYMSDIKEADPCKSYKPLHQTDPVTSLVTRVEHNIREWFTKDTICLLVGEARAKNQLLENLSQHEKHMQLCKKLNRLQLEDEMTDRTNTSKNLLKPVPKFSELQTEGKKMELKVRAFYEGRMIITPSMKDVENSNEKDNFASVLPLIDAHAPKAIRRRILLDKLNKVLPDLLLALAGSSLSSFTVPYTYNNERCAMVRILVSTFSLSATNIVFKTMEWTLVGLILIKLLSVMDQQVKILLSTKHASMYISMILMSYKLDSQYLDSLIIELTNKSDIFHIQSTR